MVGTNFDQSCSGGQDREYCTMYGIGNGKKL